MPYGAGDPSAVPDPQKVQRRAFPDVPCRLRRGACLDRGPQDGSVMVPGHGDPGVPGAGRRAGGGGCRADRVRTTGACTEKETKENRVKSGL